MKEHITNRQRVQIFRILEENCISDSEGHACYVNNYSDRRIANEVGLQNTTGVANIRKDLYGNVKTQPTGNSVNKRLDDLERRVENLEKVRKLSA